MLLLASLLLTAQPPLTLGDDAASWPQFRGPDGGAVLEALDVPLDFGPEKHVAWKAAVPAGHSSPCIQDDLLVVTGASGGRLSVTALDRESGGTVWMRSFAGDDEPDYGHADAWPAQPTPCTDGERFFVYFGSYGLVALDLEGQVQWEKRLAVPESPFGTGTSPILAGGNLILVRDGTEEAAILALDPSDGSEQWRIERFGSIGNFSTPYLWRNADREELVIPGTRQVHAFDPKTGKGLWHVNDVTLFTCTTATGDADTLYFAGWSTPNAEGRSFMEGGFGRLGELTDEEVRDPGLIFDRFDTDGDGEVYEDDVPPCRARDAWSFLDQDGDGVWQREEFITFCKGTDAPGKNRMVAVRRGGEGDVTQTHVRWTWRRGLPYVASPLLYEGRVWLAKAGGIITSLDAETGKAVIDRERLPARGEYYMSPLGVAGHVLVAESGGSLFVLNALSEDLEVVHSVDFGDELFASPAVVDGRLYLRTRGSVYAFSREATD